MRSRYTYIFVLVALLPLMIFRDFTPANELRYLSIADEAIRNGSLFAFTNHGVLYADKPPLYFWWIMLGKALLGSHKMWFLSLMSIIPAIITTEILGRWCINDIKKEYRNTSKLMMLTCGLFLGMCFTLRMDMLMCMFIILSLYTSFKIIYNIGNQKTNTILFPIYIFLGIFTKGPIALLIPLVGTITYLIKQKKMNLFRQLWGIKTWGILILGCSLWFTGVYFDGGSEYLNNLLFHQTIDRTVNSFHHKEPFYYYFVTIWYTFLPWSLLLISSIIYSLTHKSNKGTVEDFLLTIIVSTFLVFTIISSKIEIYLLPIYPLVVFSTAILLSRLKWNKWIAFTIALPAIIFSLSPLILYLVSRGDKTTYLSQKGFYFATLALVFAGILGLYQLYRLKSRAKSLKTLAIGLLTTVFIGSFFLKEINARIGYKETCIKALELSKEKGLKKLYTFKLGRSENMDIYLNQKIIKVTNEEIKNNKLNQAILIVPEKRIDLIIQYINNKEKYLVGDNYVIVL